jgi:hypothetical protein
MARNFMGYGNYSQPFTFIPRSEPDQPSEGPLNDGTSRNVLRIEFNEV